MQAGRAARHPGLARVALVVDTGEQVLNFDVDGRDGEIDVELRYDRDEEDWGPLGDPRRWLPARSTLAMTVTTRFHRVAEKHYVMRLLPGWPELSGDPRCGARIAPAPGVELRCQRWRGHEQQSEAPAHAAGSTTWRGGDPRALAGAPRAA